MTKAILAFGVTTLLALVGAFVIFEEPSFALVLSLLAGTIAAIVAYFFFPDKSVSYEAEASQLVREVERYTKKIRSYAEKLPDNSAMRNRLNGSRVSLQDLKKAHLSGSSDIKERLYESCRVVYDLLDLVREKDASNIQFVTTTIKIQVEAVSLAAEQYLKIIERPTYYHEPEMAKKQIEEGFRDFDDFVHSLVRRYNQGELDQVRIELRAVQPMKIPTLGGVERDK